MVIGHFFKVLLVAFKFFLKDLNTPDDFSDLKNHLGPYIRPKLDV